MSTQVSGVIVASLTPFREDGSLDKAALRSHVDFMIESGVNGLFCAGTYGEGPMMSLEDYRDVSQAFVEAVHGRIPIIFQAGAPSTAQAVEQARVASQAGVDYIAAVPAYYFKHDDDSLVDYYTALSQATDKPIFVYDNPGRTGNPISPALFERLIRIPRIVGMKDSSDSMVHFEKCKMVAGSDFNMIIGSDDFMLPGLVTGARGAILVLANVLPKLFVDLWNAFCAGDMAKALELQFNVLRIRAVFAKGPYVSTYKEGIRLLGRNAGYARRPLRPLTGKEKSDLESGLRKVGVL
ncbi:MAG: dihydrodipicolinate synthase family protein [Chloroflexi bacterium]|nr:dihydrodipicolinate synthase family protein [Chloroflexota bacterium]